MTQLEAMEPTADSEAQEGGERRLPDYYAALDVSDRVVVEQKTSEIRDCVGRAVNNVVEIGERLLEVKDKLAHGKFGAWLESEFGWTDRTARDLMGVARHFKSETVSDLKLGAKTLYLLASDSTPDDVRERFVERAKAGKRVTHADVRAAVDRRQPPKTKVLFAAQEERLDAKDPPRERREAQGRPSRAARVKPPAKRSAPAPDVSHSSSPEQLPKPGTGIHEQFGRALRRLESAALRHPEPAVTEAVAELTKLWWEHNGIEAGQESLF